MSVFAALLLLVSTGTALETQPIPEALAPYVLDGKLKIDDFGWMRGAFDGATDAQKADRAQINKWSDECAAVAKAKVVAELKEMGIVDPELKGAPSAPTLCASIFAYNAMLQPTRNWDEFVANEAKARQFFLVYKLGATIAAQHMPYETTWGSEDAWKLMGSTMLEQAFRSGYGWEGTPETPKLDPAILPYFEAHLGNAGAMEDRKNTAYLKKLVADKGWPSVSMVGKRASFNAWLLIQHADHDPAFQLKALRLMEPLAAKGDVSKRNYAYLYDRVHLKLNDKQRFGTQFGGCDGGEYKLQPLEDEKRLDELRAAHDLEPISEYRESMKKHAGACPITR